MCSRRLGVLTLLMLVSGFALLQAQVDRSTLTGTVTDPSGAVIPGANVTVVSASNGKQREVLTNGDGIYRVPKLPAGNYLITFSSDRFRPLRFEDVNLEVGQVATLDAQLSLAATSTQVEVKAAAQLLERDNADVAGTVYGAQIERLPTNGRNWANLLILAPLAMDDGGGDQRSIRFAGRARDDNNYRTFSLAMRMYADRSKGR